MHKKEIEKMLLIVMIAFVLSRCIAKSPETTTQETIATSSIIAFKDDAKPKYYMVVPGQDKPIDITDYVLTAEGNKPTETNESQETQTAAGAAEEETENNNESIPQSEVNGTEAGYKAIAYALGSAIAKIILLGIFWYMMPR